MTNRQQSTFFFLIVFLFACGAGLLVYKQYDSYFQEKTATDLEAASGLPIGQVKQKAQAPTVLADGRLQVDSPKEGDTVGQTFIVSGYAQDWFEGNIAIKVFDASNTPLFVGSTIAGDNYGHPAPFTSSIILTATSTTPDGKIEFNDYSAKDGSLVYQKVVNIRFSSVSSPQAGEVGGGDITSWKTYKNDQYGFAFEYPSGTEVGNQSQSINLGTYQNPVMGISLANGVLVPVNNPSLQSQVKQLMDIRLGQTKLQPSNTGEPQIDCKVRPVMNSAAAVTVVYCVGEGGPAYYALIKSAGTEVFYDGYGHGGYVPPETIDKILSTFKFTK